MLSNSSKYAVKAMVYIVTYSSPEHRLLVKDIAKETEVPRPFLSKILQILSAKNFVSSMKGPNGGFFVTKKQLQNSIFDIIVEIEGRDRLQQCVLNFENCDSQNPCPIHNHIAIAKESLRSSFIKIKLEDLKNKEILKKLK